MPFILEDGTGKGFKARVDKDNRLHTFTVEIPEEHHENEVFENAWNGAFDAIDPTSSDDYFVYIQNKAKEVRSITRIAITSTVAGFLEVQAVTGAASGGGADEVNSYTIGGADPSDFTFESGVDITNLADAGVLHFHWLEANKTAHMEFPQTIRLKTNQAIALLWTVTTGILTGTVDFYEES